MNFNIIPGFIYILELKFVKRTLFHPVILVIIHAKIKMLKIGLYYYLYYFFFSIHFLLFVFAEYSDSDFWGSTV